MPGIVFDKKRNARYLEADVKNLWEKIDFSLYQNQVVSTVKIYFDNRALCTFKTGKRYNTDLNAAYNIGSRYYLRELQKPLPERERSELEAKVPSVQRRTVCTLSDLRVWYAAYAALQAA